MLKTPKSIFISFLITSLGILAFGDLMVVSAAQVTGLTTSGSSFAISAKQLFLTAVSLIVAWVIAQFPLTSVKWFAKRSLILAIGSMALLIPFGRNINGNTNWISFGPIDLQPSEFAKLFLVLWAALIIERNLNNPILVFRSLLTGFGVVLGIVLIGQDLGSAVVIGLILATLVYLAGAQLRQLAVIASLGIFGVVTLILIQPYRIARFTAFLHPFAPDIYKNAGWQPAHSLLALGSGGFFGSGLGSSKQKWGNLAEAHTDFIFSVIGEELGLLGTFTLIIALAFLVYLIIKISLMAPDTFSRYLGLGIAFWIGLQSLFNLLSATSLIPVVGVTLPLISYGGSSLVAVVGALGYVAGIAVRNPEISEEINTRWPLQPRRRNRSKVNK